MKFYRSLHCSSSSFMTTLFWSLIVIKLFKRSSRKYCRQTVRLASHLCTKTCKVCHRLKWKSGPNDILKPICFPGLRKFKLSLGYLAHVYYRQCIVSFLLSMILYKEELVQSMSLINLLKSYLEYWKIMSFLTKFILIPSL